MKKLIYRMAAVLCLVAAVVACNESDNYPYKTDFLPVQLPGSAKWSILDVNSGALVAKDAFDVAPSPVIGGMYYVMNEDGTFNFYNVAAPTTPVNKEPYGSVTVFCEDGYAVASKRGGALCVINKQCEVVKELPKEVAQCSMFSRGMAAYQNDLGLWGYIDVKGDTVIPARFATANLFVNDDKAVVIEPDQINDSTTHFSVIDKAGKVIFTANVLDYRPVQPFYIAGVLPVIKKDTIVCLNDKGEEVPTPNKYDAIEKAGYKDFTRTAGGFYIVMGKDGKMGVVDHDNNTLIDLKHERITDLSRERYIVGKDSLWNLIDAKGNDVGNVKFVHAHGGSESVFASRGFIDVNLAAASLMALVNPGSCAGVTRGTTLMDMNSLLGDNAEALVGQNVISIPQGPFIIRYLFDSLIATKADAQSPASFNFDAKVQIVNISLNVMHCGLETEANIISLCESAMGTRGFVLDTDNVFVDDMRQAINMGYRNGVVSLCFYTQRGDVKPLPRTPRK